ncbi:hypothetical protein ACOSP7_027375 [Xanthoceras sorbifolium]
MKGNLAKLPKNKLEIVTISTLHYLLHHLPKIILLNKSTLTLTLHTHFFALFLTEVLFFLFFNFFLALPPQVASSAAGCFFSAVASSSFRRRLPVLLYVKFRVNFVSEKNKYMVSGGYLFWGLILFRDLVFLFLYVLFLFH